MATTVSSSFRRPHLVAVPFPMPGHIIPLLQLCRILASLGVSISFVTTDATASLVLDELQRHPPHLPIRLLTLPIDVSFRSLPFWDRFRAYLRACEELEADFEALLGRIHSAEVPVSAILSDVYMGWTQDVANKLGIPRWCLVTANASEAWIYFNVPRLMGEGYLPFKVPPHAHSGEADELILERSGTRPEYHRVVIGDSDDSGFAHVKGLPKLHRSEFPSFLQIEDSSDMIFSFYVDQTKRIKEAAKVLVNTFHELEASVLDEMRSELNIIPIGPLFLLDDNHDMNQKAQREVSEEEEKCLTWLDTRAPASVLFVAFGNQCTLSAAQFTEIALGLEASEQSFLWALSRDVSTLPEGFVDSTQHRGIVVNRAPQLLVLGHAAVGGFLSHCGWNSTLESITLGVPMLCCPQAADQVLTCKLMVEVWKAGMRLGEGGGQANPKWEEVASLAKELILGEEGKNVRYTAKRLSDAAKIAALTGGDSQENILHLTQALTSSNHSTRTSFTQEPVAFL